MFDNKIFNIITRTLGAIFLLIMGYLAVMIVVDIVIFFDLKQFIITFFGYLIAFVIVGFMCICIGEFITWIFEKLSK